MLEKRAETQWNKSEISLNNYYAYILRKQHKFNLTLIDLLYISNFKGGYSTINEPEGIIAKKLKSYSPLFVTIFQNFGSKKLRELEEPEISKLIKIVLEVIELSQNENTKIDGFGVSYISALLNAYFPDLIPIIDRRVLFNLHLVVTDDIDNQGQIKNIKNYYEKYLRKIAKITRSEARSIREIDRELFIQKIVKYWEIG